MTAQVQNPVSSRLVGINVNRMLMLGWGLAGAVGAVGGMMVAPSVFLDPNMMNGLLIFPAGAVLGGFIVGISAWPV